MATPRLVLKFGGTSMANPERIAHSASIVAAEARQGKQVAVVVSAMAGETDRLLSAAEALGGGLGELETDTVLAAGEQASAAWMVVVVIIGNVEKIITVVKDADFGQAITHILYSYSYYKF